MHASTPSTIASADRLAAFIASPSYKASFQRASNSLDVEHENDTFAEASGVMEILAKKIKEKVAAKMKEEKALESTIEVEEVEMAGVGMFTEGFKFGDAQEIDQDEVVEESCEEKVSKAINKLELQDSAISVSNIHVEYAESTPDLDEPPVKEEEMKEPIELPFLISVSNLPPSYIVCLVGTPLTHPQESDLEELRELDRKSRKEYFELLRRQDEDNEKIANARIELMNAKLARERRMAERMEEEKLRLDAKIFEIKQEGYEPNYGSDCESD